MFVVENVYLLRGVPVREDTYPEASACEVGGGQFLSSPPLFLGTPSYKI